MYEAIGPEEYYSIELRCNIQDWLILREDAQRAAIDARMPVRIDVVGGGDAAAVFIRIFYVLFVMRAEGRIASDHSLQR